MFPDCELNIHIIKIISKEKYLDYEGYVPFPALRQSSWNPSIVRAYVMFRHCLPNRRTFISFIKPGFNGYYKENIGWDNT